MGNPFHPLESSSQVESWCPCNKFRFLNLKEGDSASAKSIEKTIYFEHSWRPGRNGDSAALNANRKTHLAQRRAILTNVFINVRSLQGDLLLEPSELNRPKPLCRAAWVRHREAVSQKRQPWTETVPNPGEQSRRLCLVSSGNADFTAHVLPRPALEGWQFIWVWIITATGRGSYE